MNKLRLASFGIRGYVGESLPPTTVIDFASAFATNVDGGRVLLGRDTRYSSPMLHAAVLSGLMSGGCEVFDLGVCPTPLLQFAVKSYGAMGAVSITGGHNSMGWNSVTLIGADGAFIEPVGGESVLDSFHARIFRQSDWCSIGKVKQIEDAADSYFEALAQWVNLEAIRKANFRILIDPVGGAGCAYLDAFAQQLNLNVVSVNAEPSGYLAREPEPRPRSALQMASIIGHTGAQAGFLLSSDMGRVSMVTETGEPTSEEYTFPLIANHVLAKRSGPVVTNICTTRTLDEIARRHKVPLIKTRVGQAYVLSTVRDTQAVLGGEGSGSVALPAFSPAFDGFMMMALILEAMAETELTLSALVKQLPRYHIIKRTVPCGSRDGYLAVDALRELATQQGQGEVDYTDGLRVDFEDSWVHVRISQTQQMVRIIAEATDAETAEQRAEESIRVIQKIL